MGIYRVRAEPKGVAVQHIAVFPFFMGCLAVVGGATGFFFWSGYLENVNGIDFWMPMLIGPGVVAVGLYLLLVQPASKQALFLIDSKELEVRQRSLLSSSKRILNHKGLETLSVLATDSDGYWYTPIIELADEGNFEIGFGCHDAASAQSVIDRIRESDETSRKTASPK